MNLIFDIGKTLIQQIDLVESINALFPVEEPFAVHCDDPTVTNFTLRPSATADGILYSDKNTPVGTIEMKSGTLEEVVYVTENGLHITGFTKCIFPAKLHDQFTIALTITDFSAPDTTSYGLFPLMIAFPYAQLETVIHAHYDVSRNKYLWNYINRSGSLTVDTAEWVRNIPMGPASDPEAVNAQWICNPSVTPDFVSKSPEMSIRYVSDGETVSMWVNGIKTAEQPYSEFTNDVETIQIGSLDNSLELACEYVIKSFKILNYAEIPDEYDVYRLRITGVKDSTSPYMQMSGIFFYDAAQNRIDLSDAIPFGVYDGSAEIAYTDSGVNTPFMLFDSDEATKLCVPYEDGKNFDVIFSVPASTEKPQYFAYVTANDQPGRDPVSWELQRYDSGVWETIGSVTDAEIPDERFEETQAFRINA